MNTASSSKALWSTKSAIFYIASFLNSFSSGIIGPLFIIYLLSINFNPAQIGILLAIERLSIIIFEVPTGIFADKYGRKMSLLVSFFLIALVLIVWFFSTSFYILLILAVVWGFAYTFQSGAKESLMIDSLDLEKNDKKRNRVFTRLSVFGSIGFLFGGLLSALLAFYFLRSIWLAAGFLNILLFVLYFFFTNENRQIKFDSLKAKNKIKGMINLTKDNIKFVFERKIIISFLAITMILGLATSIYGLSYPILFKQVLNIPNYYFGFLGALSALVGIIGALLGEKLTKKKGYFFTMSCFPLTLFILFLFFGFSITFWLGLILFALIELMINGWYPIFQSFFNKFIPNKIRSGILSINSTVSLLAIAVGELLAGFLLTIISPSNLIAWSGLIFILIPVLLFVIKRPLTKQEVGKI